MHKLRDIIHHEIIEKRYKLFDFHPKIFDEKNYGTGNSLASDGGRKNRSVAITTIRETLYNRLENGFETCLPLGSHHHLNLAQRLCMQLSRARARDDTDIVAGTHSNTYCCWHRYYSFSFFLSLHKTMMMKLWIFEYGT